MESARVVEVLHDRGEEPSPRWLLGSGFIVKSGIVLTAAHNLGSSASESGPNGTVVRCLDGGEHRAQPLVRSDEVDLALLTVPEVKAQAAKLGNIDRDRIGIVRDVTAVGFPNYKYAEDRPVHLKRQPAQPVGSIPTVEDLPMGLLTLKVQYGEPAPPSEEGTSPWEGLSGAGVVVGGHLVGVVIEHHMAEGLGALRLVPLERLVDAAEADRALFYAVLGIDDPGQLPLVGRESQEDDEVPAELVRQLKELIKLTELGLIGAGELQALRITAVKEAKGWR